MVRSFLLTLGLLMLGSWAIGQTALQGKITDPDGPAYGATVKVFKNSVFVTGTTTDSDGKYVISLDPSTYDVEFSALGFTPERVSGVVVFSGKTIFLNKTFKKDEQSEGVTLIQATITAYKIPLIQQDNTTQGGSFTADQIRNLPTKSVNAMVGTVAGASSVDGGNVTIRGSRDNATNYYIDGVRVSKNNLPPAQDIDQLNVVTGGIGAEYGDVTGGVITIFTKGPASKYSGGVEVETSEFLDAFGYTQVNANLSGPIIKKKSGETILGFRLSGTGQYEKDDDRPGINVYSVTDEKYAELAAHPTRKLGQSVLPAGELLTNDDVDVLKYRPNENRSSLDITGKLDLRLTSNIDVSLSGTFNDTRDKITPGTNKEWGVINSRNNPTRYDNRTRGILRFRHRLGGVTDENAKDKKQPLISNAQYSLSFAYENNKEKLNDPRHGENLFDYGYIGKFDYQWDEIFGPTPNGDLGHIDWRQNFTGYTAGDKNPILANYNEFVNREDVDSYIRLNGYSNNIGTGIWNGSQTNVGTTYNLYRRNDNDTYTLNATTNFNLSPGGSKKGTHAIQLGLMYEQRIERNYDLLPYELQRIGELRANVHILGVDTTIKLYKVPNPDPSNGDSVWIYGKRVVDTPDSKFYKKIRESEGVDLKDFINVQAIDPGRLRLDMFSPKELTDQELLGYYGYDYLGKKLKTQPSFNDFFTKKDADGIRVFPVGARTPVYQAAYVQDKFSFRDIIFRVGVRVDRYDANTKIMKDPYSLYELKDAKDFYNVIGKPQPGNVGSDWKIYVDEVDDKAVKAYRDGDQWYDKNGSAVSDGNVIFGGGVVTPSYKFADPDIKSSNFDPNQSFEDYKPQVNITPRLAFSFPISEDANFFAHYDILVQRPPGDNFKSALDYFYFYDKLNTPDLSNAALKPERTIDYEVGFQQKLTNYSAIKFSAYYKELRDMIQRRTYAYVPTVNEYNTYGNSDFGTVKGFSFQYDLRRIQNAQLQLAYTLQFADGTGSDANSQKNISQRGNIRTLYPLNFDERHNIQAVIDYRFDRGKRYNGPTIGGKDILAEFGANLTVSAVSGRPYTAKERPTQFDGAGTQGALNGNRYPWRTRLDLRLDKNVNLSKNPASPLSLNVYFRVSNLLGTKNVNNVYGATGSPTDDGFRDTPDGRSQIGQVISNGQSLESYNASYQWRVLNPENFGQPRRIFVGAIFSF